MRRATRDGESSGLAEGIAQVLIVGRLAADVADSAPQISLQFAHGPIGPLVLLGVPSQNATFR